MNSIFTVYFHTLADAWFVWTRRGTVLRQLRSIAPREDETAWSMRRLLATEAMLCCVLCENSVEDLEKDPRRLAKPALALMRLFATETRDFFSDTLLAADPKVRELAKTLTGALADKKEAE